MNKFFRPVAAALAFALALALLPCGAPVSARNALPFSGSGADDDPYLIATAEELYAFSARVAAGDDCAGESFLLTEDIELNDVSDFDEWAEYVRPENIWQPIGTGLTLPGGAVCAFRGNFSGGGHTVRGMYVFASAGLSGAGFFGVAEGGSITDLFLESSLVCGEARMAGGVVGSANGVRLARLGFSGAVRGLNAVGGVVGDASDSELTNCTADAAVSGERSVGSVAGSAARTRFENCDPSGGVSAEQYAGGLAGIAEASLFLNCESRAAVSAPDRAGGAVGFCYDCSFENCVNRGPVLGMDRAGGLAGHVLTSDMTDCENLGAVVGERYLGGVCGIVSGCTLAFAVNRAAVTGEDYVGGIVGWSDDGADFGQNGLISELSRCMNTGAVRGEWGIGGLIGDAHSAQIADCFNIGAVSSVEYAGGLIGYTADCTVRCCYNVGTVSAETAAGGVVGRNSMGRTSFENCFYLASCCAAGDEYGTARDEYELLDAASYTAFDLDTVWELAESGYPFARLRTERLAPPSRVRGDLDGDGEATLPDALTALRIAMGIFPCTPLALFGGDADGSGSLDAADALIIMRISMGLLQQYS